MAKETPAIPVAVTEAESAGLLRRMREAQQALGDRALVPATGQRFLRIAYSASGNCPTSGAVGIDNSLSFLATRAASFLPARNGNPAEGERLKGEALGPKMEADGSGGILRSLVLPMLREKQNRPKRPGPFRRRRLMERMIY